MTTQHQIELAKKEEARLAEKMKPYLREWRIVSRIKRRLGKIRKARIQLEQLQDKGETYEENHTKTNGVL